MSIRLWWGMVVQAKQPTMPPATMERIVPLLDSRLWVAVAVVELVAMQDNQEEVGVEG